MTIKDLVDTQRSWARRTGERISRYDQLSARWPVLAVPSEFARAYREVNARLLAGAIAFRTFLWLMPFVLFAIGILSAFKGDSGLMLAHHVDISGHAADQIRVALQDNHKSWWVAALIGLVGVVTSGLSLVRDVHLAYYRIWNLEPQPIRNRLGVLGALTGGMAVLIFVRGLVGHFGNVRLLTATAIISVQFVVVTVVWLWVSWWLPHAKVNWRGLIPGALLMTITFSILHAVSAFYLPHKIARASALYGAIGVSFTILAWLLVLAYIIVSAALLNVVWSKHYRP